MNFKVAPNAMQLMKHASCLIHLACFLLSRKKQEKFASIILTQQLFIELYMYKGLYNIQFVLLAHVS